MSEYAGIIPIVIVALSAAAAMLAEAFRQRDERMPIAGLGLIGLVGAAIASGCLWNSDAHSMGVIRSDNFALFVNIILCAVGILTMLFSNEVIEREQIPSGEYYALTLFAICGMMMMAAATDLLVIFIALEVLSLAVYVLTGIRRQSAAGAEAAFKYFLLGAFSSAFFLYGVAFAYALSGSTRIEEIGMALSAQATGPPSTVALLTVGVWSLHHPAGAAVAATADEPQLGPPSQLGAQHDELIVRMQQMCECRAERLQHLLGVSGHGGLPECGDGSRRL